VSRFNSGMKACGAFLLWATAAIALPSQTFTTLHSFDNTDGTNPFAGLVQATNGNFYGTTTEGGANGDGTVFKMTPSGTLTTLHSFGGADGGCPEAGLVQATDGNLYGTTFLGGANGFGTVFKITQSGTLTTLHSFDYTDGYLSEAGLVQATDGNLYGTTEGGGANGFGTVFKITPSGTLTTLHSFGGTDGSCPEAGLVRATDGNFYGSTTEGGANGSCNNTLDGCGTVFKITPSGMLTTLHSFDFTDGAAPFGTLVQAGNGNLYGTTQVGGANNNCGYGCGTVFKITLSGTLTMLHSFDGTDGAYPNGLVQATDGDFYGTGEAGGANGQGSVFKITPSGILTRLYTFCSQSGCPDGEYPVDELAQASNGNLYGTAYYGGANINSSCPYGCGTVFSLSVGLGPFVETLPTSRMVGAAVKILGTNLTGATSVTFNGTAATFTVISKSLITTSVPAGATTGTVQVVTPDGTLSSNVPFRVTP
jgi:uncharacterized repeat protein (TIGR03803 family)